MGNLCIVAIPAADDDIWQESSEKVPHMTILFLGDAMSNPNVSKIVDKVGEAAKYLEPFSLIVEHRGVLGPDKADVLFFDDDNEDLPWPLTEFRSSLLYDINIKNAYEALPQYVEWQPHITLGYPETPAKEYNLEPNEQDYVTFDRVAVWYGDFEGPEFTLTENTSPTSEDSLQVPDAAWSATMEDVLSHHGVKGQKWGVRKAISEKRTASADKKFEKKAPTLSTKIDLHNRAADLMDKHGDLERINNKPVYHKAAEAGHLTNDNHPTTKKYMDEVMNTYVKRVNEAAAEKTNKSGTKQYTAKRDEQSLLGFSVHTTDIKHADDEPFFKVKHKRNKKGQVIGHELQKDHLEQASLVIGDFLAHHGVKGMRWGVRNGKGSPTAVTVSQKGKKKLKAKGGEGHPAAKEAIVAKSLGQQAKKSGHQSLSNEELKTYASRLQLEQNVKNLERQNKSGPRRFISGTLKSQGNQSANKLAGTALTKIGKTAVAAAAV